MAAANQSTRPSIFLPIIKTTVATALNISPTFVRLVAKPDLDKWSYHTGDTAAAIYLDPQLDQSAAGAGRVGTPLSQVLEVTIRTRNLGSQAGGNETCLPGHLDKELAVINAIHLVHLTDDTNVPLFIMPPRMIPNGEPVIRTEKLVGDIESRIRFRLDYVLAVTL